MDIIHIIILSIVEGITEFLPISSTAHLILTSHLLKIPQTEFLTTFEIAIQLGAILAVVVLYFKKILSNKSLFLKACVGFIPTGILGLLFFKHIKTLLSDAFIPVLALFLGGIAIIGIEKYFESRIMNHELWKKDRNENKQVANYKLQPAEQSLWAVPTNSRELTYKQ